MILFSSQTNFKVKQKLVLKKWIKFVCADFNKTVTDLNFIFMDDDQLLDINVKYLNHYYFTDVITFDYCADTFISGDIFISIDRVKDNSSKYSDSFRSEFLRVVVHGVLHLIGYDDKTDEQRKLMRQLENKYIKSEILSQYNL